MPIPIISTLSLVSKLKSAWVPWLLLLASIAICMTGYALMSGSLEREETSHSLTKQYLQQAQEQLLQMRAVIEAKERSVVALRETLQEALDREKEALAAAAARKRILDAMQSRPRTPEEKEVVVDDETRKAVADRLNRPL